MISDTHNQHNKINLPEADLLIVAGDITGRGYQHEVIGFDKWLGENKHKYKEIVLIAGNHDFIFDKKDEDSHGKKYITNAVYLENSSYEFEGFKIWGSPQQPYFYNWAFNEFRGKDIKRYWDMVPKDTQILITHGPPYGIMDEPREVFGGETAHVGCEDLTETIKSLKDLKLHVFGHIHEGYGTVIKDGITYVNASSVCEDYKNVHKPIIIEVN
jgi:Icc-related predicted phosphoesterase